jgi:hypothetical protein
VFGLNFPRPPTDLDPFRGRGSVLLARLRLIGIASETFHIQPPLLEVKAVIKKNKLVG